MEDARNRTDEAELVERVVAGRRGAVADLIGAYGNLVRRIVHRMVDDPRDREEVLQDTFVQTVRAMPRFRGEARLSTWIGRIAYRQCAQYLRRRKIPLEREEPRVDSDSLRDPVVPPIEWLEQRQLEERVQRLVKRLSPAQRAAVTLFYLEEMSIAETARIMAVPDNTVKSHLHRARTRLRELLEKEADERE
ncbi:MAG: RNA polymerase sigma factor [Gemmatimonadota bacterium]